MKSVTKMIASDFIHKQVFLLLYKYNAQAHDSNQFRCEALPIKAALMVPASTHAKAGSTKSDL